MLDIANKNFSHGDTPFKFSMHGISIGSQKWWYKRLESSIHTDPQKGKILGPSFPVWPYVILLKDISISLLLLRYSISFRSFTAVLDLLYIHRTCKYYLLERNCMYYYYCLKYLEITGFFITLSHKYTTNFVKVFFYTVSLGINWGIILHDIILLT